MFANLVVAIPVQFVAWVFVIVSLSFEPLQWMLIPNVNNTPAFITVSKWLLQGLVVSNLLGYLLLKLWTRTRHVPEKQEKWRFSVHAGLAAAHILVISLLIILVAGGEDL